MGLIVCSRGAIIRTGTIGIISKDKSNETSKTLTLVDMEVIETISKRNRKSILDWITDHLPSIMSTNEVLTGYVSNHGSLIVHPLLDG